MTLDNSDGRDSGKNSIANCLQEARKTLATEIRQARGGVQATQVYSTKIDHLLGRIRSKSTASPDSPVALVAIGGYGRSQLCLYSDIDLLILFGGPIASNEEQLVKDLLHPLWDLGLDVGQQVRQIDELSHPETDNPSFLVAVADARFVTGDAKVFNQFIQHVRGPEAIWRQATIEALRGLVEERYRHFNSTIYQLEPDVKEAPGALRDVAAIRALASLAKASETPIVPTPSGRLDDALSEAEDFLLRIRSILHLDNGRNLNTLSHDHQETVAKRFGSPGSETGGQVETLMSAYFHHARIIARILTTNLNAISPVSGPGRRRRIADNIECNNQLIHFIDNVRASLQPHTWLEVFQAAIDEGYAVAQETLAFMERHGDRYPTEAFLPGTKARDQLLHFLKPKPGLYERLSEMHENRLLSRIFPEFRKIYCRVIRDFYHKYTVDEHTLLTIRNLCELTDPNTAARSRFGGVLAELEQPELIVLALLFHDVGKWTNKNHAEESVRMARGPLRRLKISIDSIQTVEFLVRHHLQMSQTAFRRDTGDLEVTRQFARLVGTEDRLKMLCLLTVADIQAVSPEALTPWKEELLWKLYVDTYNHLTLGYGDELIATSQPSVSELRKLRPPEISEHQVTEFLEGLPQRYLRLVDTQTVYRHIKLSRSLEPTQVRLSLVQDNDVWELSVVTQDRPRIFSNICGVLSYFGMDILRGQAMSNHQEVVLDLFRFIDADRFLAMNRSGRSDLTTLLEGVVSGVVDLGTMLKGREAAAQANHNKLRVRTVVHFDHHYSDRYTVLEVVGTNQWGLLHRISRVISEHGCDIELVLISTEGNRAIDVFHLTSSGKKLGPDKEENLSTDLKQALTSSSSPP
ncbi:MAG: hypothetical protein CL484_01880 [Acidobacteria bacterium]|nr:hypothetical protein [Acidobacteriota bacterium]